MKRTDDSTTRQGNKSLSQEMTEKYGHDRHVRDSDEDDRK